MEGEKGVKHTLISTHLRCTFIRTCNPRISVNGPKILSQSFFRGVILWGGIGIRLISDLRVVFSAPGATGGNANAEVSSDKRVGSVSIIGSSSTFAVIIVGSASISRDEEPAARVDKIMSVSPSSSLSRCEDEEGKVWVGFLRVIFLLFFFAFTPEDGEVVETDNLGVATIVLLEHRLLV